MLKSLLLAGAMTLAFSGTAMAKPEGFQLIVANNPSVGSTKIGILYTLTPNMTWETGTTLNANAPSTQKTLGASKARLSIMYRKADGNTYVVDGSMSNGGVGVGWSANFDEGAEEPIFLDNNLSGQFKLTPEEIEIDPISNDIFALVSGSTAFAPKQIYRIKRNPDGINIATAMTMHNTSGAITPNGNRAYVNPLSNGYKSGSIAIVPNPNGGHRLVFTSESTVYQGICHWVYDIQTGTDENKLKASVYSPSNNVPMSKCQKTTPLNGLTAPGAGIAAGTGINTVYIGPQTASASGGIIPGRLLMSRNGGPMYEIEGLLTPGLWKANLIVPASPNHTLSNDFAWYRNQWVQEQ